MRSEARLVQVGRTSLRAAVICWSSVAVLAWSAGSARAQEGANTDAGFDPGKAYQIGDVDSVNLFNGNLTLQVPLSIEYPVGRGLSYRFTLLYNSEVWDFDTVAPSDPDLPEPTVAFANGSAGLGWHLSFGSMSVSFPPNEVAGIYFDPQGGRHQFYPSLHEGEPSTPGVGYTRDGSYLRLKAVGNGVRLVEYPDGTIHEFNAEGRIQKIRSHHSGAWVAFDYTYVSGLPVMLTVWDSHGRTHEARFTTAASDPEQPPYSFTVLTSLAVERFGGGPRAETTFEYDHNVSINQACPANLSSDKDPELQRARVAFLKQINLPDGSHYAPGPYNTTAPHVSDIPNAGCEQSGLIEGLRLPTGGRLEWTHQHYKFPLGSNMPLFDFSAGVATRTRIDVVPQGNPQVATWTYTTFVNPQNRSQVVNTVTDPLGHYTKHYFNGLRNPLYGMPFTSLVQSDGKFLSTETFAAGTTTPLRSTYVLYEHDTPTPPVIDRNARLKGTRTVFHDPGGDRRLETDFSDFDELGNYRQVVSSGTFGTGDVRTSFTSYNPNGSPFPVAQAWVLNTFTVQRVSERRGTTETGTFTRHACFDSRGTLRRLRTLRSTAGSGALDAHDVVRVYVPDYFGGPEDRGFIVAEELYGGDRRTVDTSAGWCNVNLGTPEYAIDMTYQNGALQSSKYRGANFLTVDRRIDASTGLVSLSRDPALLQTTFDYDVMGRLAWVRPAEDAWTTYGYTLPSGSSSPRITERRVTNGYGSGPELTFREIFLDGFGRVFRDRRRGGSAMDETKTLYDKAGNMVFQSEVGHPDTGTTYSGFDPFGRPDKITAADGSVVDLRYQGEFEVERTVRVATSESSPGVFQEQLSTTIERRDQHGRLWQVVEPIGLTATYFYDAMDHLTRVEAVANGALQVRELGYDGRGFLLWENHPEKDNNGHNPIGYPTGTDVDREGFDTMGNAGLTADGPFELFYAFDNAGRLTRIDWARTGPVRYPMPRALKEVFYGDGTSPSDRSKGKVVLARRHNWRGANGEQQVLQITTHNTYGGRGGRLSERDLTLGYQPTPTTPPTFDEAFTQGWTYDELGNVESIAYPQCTFPECRDTAQTAVFADVPPGHPFKAYIEAAYGAGLTIGCTTTSPPLYCPNTRLNRAEMSVFLLRAIEGTFYTPPQCGAQIFNDVPCSFWAAPWINELSRRGVTVGCGGSNFCPATLVKREQMAVFLTRVHFGLGYEPPSCSAAANPWTDVSCSRLLAPWILAATRAGLMEGCGGSSFCPDHEPTRAEMAKILTDGMNLALPANSASPRVVRQLHKDGLLTQVSGYAQISYHPNLLVRQAAYANGDTWNQAIAPHGMPRPAQISTSYGGVMDFRYDSAGNVLTVGPRFYHYDLASRVTYERDASPQPQFIDYDYDGFGNLRSILSNDPAGRFSRMTPTSTATNRLTSATYDAAGNMTWWNGAVYEYDALNQIRRVVNGTEDWQYMYDAAEERVLSIRLGQDRFDRWTLRDTDGKVLRTYEATNWTWGAPHTDHVYRGRRLLATEGMASGQGRRWATLDHLGTPRVFRNADGSFTGHHYTAFGEEFTDWTDGERIKFTGHERDGLRTAGPADDLDYMHARFYNPQLGRFLRVDPAGGRLGRPHTLNLYNYVSNAPLNFVDPDGREEEEYSWWDGVGYVWNAMKVNTLLHRELVRGTVAAWRWNGLLEAGRGIGGRTLTAGAAAQGAAWYISDEPTVTEPLPRIPRLALTEAEDQRANEVIVTMGTSVVYHHKGVWEHVTITHEGEVVGEWWELHPENWWGPPEVRVEFGGAGEGVVTDRFLSGKVCIEGICAASPQ